MKKIIIAALMLIGASTASFAQQTQQAIEQQAQAITTNVHQAVNLTADQQAQVQAVNIIYVTHKNNILQAGTAASPERTTIINQYKNNKYQEIMTPAQFALYEAMPQ